MKESIPTQQIIDASGEYASAAKATGMVYERPSERLSYPTFNQALTTLIAETNTPGGLVLGRDDLAAKQARLRQLSYLRVMVAVQGKKNAAYLPGIILPDGGARVRVGCLTSAHDALPTEKNNATTLFSDLQHLLLAKMAAEHQPNSGSHAGGQVNGAEINHAVVVASSRNPLNIHNTVHNLVDSRSFSARIALTGATNIQTAKGLRVNTEQTFGLDEVTALIIMKDNQIPFPLGGDSLNVSAGFTFAAVRSQSERPQPNLRANFDNLQAAVS
jgi:hypothetical protein